MEGNILSTHLRASEGSRYEEPADFEFIHQFGPVALYRGDCKTPLEV